MNKRQSEGGEDGKEGGRNRERESEGAGRGGEKTHRKGKKIK